MGELTLLLDEDKENGSHHFYLQDDESHHISEGTWYFAWNLERNVNVILFLS